MLLTSDVPCEFSIVSGRVVGIVGVPSLRSAELGDRSSPGRCVVTGRFASVESVDRSNRGVVDITLVVIDEFDSETP